MLLNEELGGPSNYPLTNEMRDWADKHTRHWHGTSLLRWQLSLRTRGETSSGGGICYLSTFKLLKLPKEETTGWRGKVGGEGRGPYTDGIIVCKKDTTAAADTSCPSLSSLCSFPIFRVQQAHQMLSPQQGADIALPGAQQVSPPLSNICKAHTRTRGKPDVTSHWTHWTIRAEPSH